MAALSQIDYIGTDTNILVGTAIADSCGIAAD
jgi:hypothetical protein